MPQVREISGHEVRKSLSVLLREPHDDQHQAYQRALSFENMANVNNFDLNRQIVVSSDDNIEFSCFFMPQKGGTAFIFLSDPSKLSDQSQILALEALNQLIENASFAELSFLQLMVCPEESAKIKLAKQAGFEVFSTIHYMYREINSKIGVVRIPPKVSWQNYSKNNHDIFAAVIEQSWQESLDCPELPTVRSVEETIESYKAAGIFTRTYWSLMLVDDEPAGICLLSPLNADKSIELTYTGVIPKYRGQGLGRVMLNRAISLSAIDGYKIMTLAVDKNNHYAMNMYRESGFSDMFIKTAMLYVFGQ